MSSTAARSMEMIVATESNDNDNNNNNNNNNNDNDNDNEQNRVKLFDSLPYIDPIHPNYEQYASSLIEEEMRHQQLNVLHPNLQSLQAQQLHVENALPPTITKTVDTTTTSMKFPSKPINDTSFHEWKETIRNARVVYENERIRNILLNLDKEEITIASKNDHNAPAALPASALLLKRYNEELLMNQKEYYDRLLQLQQNIVTTINYHRQQNQVEQYSKKLVYYTNIQNDLFSKIYTLKLAIHQLENEIQSSSPSSNS